jgi:hypothetical protein
MKKQKALRKSKIAGNPCPSGNARVRVNPGGGGYVAENMGVEYR